MTELTLNLYNSGKSPDLKMFYRKPNFVENGELCEKQCIHHVQKLNRQEAQLSPRDRVTCRIS